MSPGNVNVLRVNVIIKVITLALVACLLPSARLVSSTSTAQIDALRDLYNSAGGEAWHWGDSGIPWDFNSTAAITPCQSQWAFITCDSQLENITALVMNSTNDRGESGVNMIGTLPQSLGQLSMLTTLGIYHNPNLNGSLPASIGDISSLQYLSLLHNHLSFALPESIYGLTSLRTVDLTDNWFDGPLSESIGQWSSHLTQLLLTNNSFDGPLPQSLMNCTLLTTLHLSFNQFNGSLPETISQLTSLSTLALSSNRISSSLPNSLSQMKQLTRLELGNNYLKGPINESLFSLPLLKECLLNLNFFTGTIPSAFLTAQVLRVVDFGHNDLHGPVPDALWQSTTLQFLFMGSNHLSGSLPDNVPIGSPLLRISLSNNSFTGSLPHSIVNAVGLQSLALDFNAFRGPLVNSYAQLTNLTVLAVSSNQLTGSIPQNYSQLQKLRIIEFANNSFTGTVSGLFNGLRHLQALYIQSNQFHGPITQLVNHSLQQYILDIDISSNSFSGTLPSDIFHLPRLSLFSAVKNCFSGSIPLTICEANQTLSLLALDGLHTSLSCVSRIFPTLRTFQLSHPLDGNLPSCLFRFPLLTTLHMSGNGLRGSFPEDIVSISDSLTSLVLSHNRLTGTIPEIIQTHPWQELDLSFNKFSGEVNQNLSSFVSPARNLQLSINRLSGTLPVSLRHASDVNVLSGNIFYCESNKAQLPLNDTNFDAYECGSNSVNDALYGWLAVMVVSGIIAFVIFFRHVLLPNTTKELAAMAAAARKRNALESASATVGERPLSCKSMTGVTPAADVSVSSAKETKTTATAAAADAHIEVHSTEHTAASDTVTDPSSVVEDDNAPIGDKDEENNVTSATGDGSDDNANPALIATHANPSTSNTFGLSSVHIDFSGISASSADLLSLSLKQVTRWQLRKRFVKAMDILERRVLSYWELYTSGAAATFHNQPLEELNELGVVFREVRRWCMRLTAVIVLVFLPIYPSLSLYYGSYSHSYAWTVSLGYLTGKPPVIVTFTLLVLFVFIIYARPLVETHRFLPFKNKLNIYYLLSRMTVKAKIIYKANFLRQLEKKIVTQRQKKKMRERLADRATLMVANVVWYMRIAMLLILNCAVVLAVNMGYVYMKTTNISGVAKQIIALIVSVYKLVWTELTMMMFERIKSTNPSIFLRNIVGTDDFVNLENVTMNKEVYSILAANMTWLSIFNNIIAPFIAVAFISPNCFYYAVYPAPDVSTSYSLDACKIGWIEDYGSASGSCESLTHTSTTFYSPPFIYQFSCSSTLLTYFAEIFIYRYIIGSVLLPASFLCLKYFQEKAYKNHGGESNRIYQYTTYMLPPPLRPSSFLPVEKTPAIFCGMEEKFLNLESNIITLVTDVGILLTFGTVFPPLAIVGCLSIVLSTYFFQLQLGRIVVLARTQRYLQVYLDRIIVECVSIRGLLVHSMKSLCVLLAVYWSIFLFDAWGDLQGAADSAWIFAVMIAIPAIIATINVIFNAVGKKDVSILKDHELDHSFQDRDSAFAMSESGMSNPNWSIASRTTETEREIQEAVNGKQQPVKAVEMNEMVRSPLQRKQ